MYRDGAAPDAPEALDGSHAYRLKEWPELPERFRSAKVLRACSRMSVGPVTANWFLEHIGLEPQRAGELMSLLIARGAVEPIDLGPRALPPPAAAPAEKTRNGAALWSAWKHAATAAIMCLGVSAALDERFPVDFGTFAIPTLPVVFG